MAKFIEVTDARYSDKLILNIEQIVAIFPSGRVLTTGVHGGETGFLDFAGEELQKIIDATKD